MASCKLWCRRGDAIFELNVEIGVPFQVREIWYCEWAIDPLALHRPRPAESNCSMHVLACALTAISSYLHTRQKIGDRFYMEPDITSEELEDLDLIFPRLKITPRAF